MIFKGVGLVWDKEKKKILCEFKNGLYKTRKPREKEILINLGYKYTEEQEDINIDENVEDAEFQTLEETEEELRARAKSAGVSNYWNKTVETLKADLEEGE